MGAREREKIRAYKKKRKSHIAREIGANCERACEERKIRSLMPILQPVQRGLLFRRSWRSAGGFCRPFKPTGDAYDDK